MSDYNYEDRESEERRIMRARRLERMKEQKEQQRRRRKMLKTAAPPVLGVAAVGLLFFAGKGLLQKEPKEQTDKEQTAVNVASAQMPPLDITEKSITDSMLEYSAAMPDIAGRVLEEEQTESVMPAKVYSAGLTEKTLSLGEKIVSSQAVLIDTEKEEILAQKDYQRVISPASMTKILTILVAAEHVTDLDDIFTMTIDITDYSYVNDCSNVGFLVGEEVTVRDLFYGTILPSGGDAAVGLATYVAGSQEAFVELMNEKLEELGLSDTAHFTNCVGLYDEEHYCTVYDMAMILQAALDNELCREVLSAHTYTTTETEQHPEGITISNWFLRRIEDKDTGGEVLCGKTGYVVQSGNCAASYALDEEGKGYICVTADAGSGWQCIYDHVALYEQFLGANLPLQNDRESV